MSDWWIGFLSAFVPTAATATLGWFRFFHEVRVKNHERESKERAESELQLIRRRSLDDSPYLTPSNERFNGVTFPGEKPGETYWLPAGGAALLCFLKNEIGDKVPEGTEIYMVLDNKGSSAQEIKITLDEQPIKLLPFDFENQTNPGIVYPLNPQIRGKEQVVSLSFLARNGSRDTHLYVTRHGFRIFKRIDPS
jgi:hypothetical protein